MRHQKKSTYCTPQSCPVVFLRGRSCVQVVLLGIRVLLGLVGRPDLVPGKVCLHLFFICKWRVGPEGGLVAARLGHRYFTLGESLEVHEWMAPLIY